ncbi:tetratricopeptide repeat protein [uncultured Sphingomonas sp.]|uniref:tetratricopeptide repeat protein n=1 Tax=uncultured Sphingomonas sp. TaxID=158754 RepID=UPI0025FED2B4|nr:tetratricopeptide repeat protein [uncultured Sphingomonas sp.]
MIRWARERGLPVHALPGGKARSVYALAAELDAWMSGQGALADRPEPVPPPPAPPEPAAVEPGPVPAPVARCRWPWVAGVAALLLAGGVVGAGRWSATPATLDGAAHARFVAARDDVALRAAPRLRHAIATLGSLARDHPGNAPVQEALAEAWLLAREFGSAPDAQAFARARAAAAAARAIDPASAVADRVDAVAAYWWDRDPARAGRLFRRAIGHAPNDPLAHLWYANILADNGEDAAALREFDAARMLAPGAPWLLADYGWGLWSAGRTAEGEALLDTLAAQHPALSSVQDCLSVMALAQGDLPGYVRHLVERARLRDERELIAYGAALGRTLDRNDPDAVQAVMLSRAIAFAQNTDRPDHSWPAFVAAMAGDRGALLAILGDARARGERWGAAGFVRRIRTRFAGDTTVSRALDALAQDRIEPA